MAKTAIRNDEEISVHSNFQIIKRLLKYLLPYKLQILTVLLLLIFVMITGVLNPYFLQLSVDKYIAEKNLTGLYTIAIVMLIYNFAAMLASILRTNMMGRITNQILVEIRQELYAHIQKLTFSFFDNRPVGKILARVIGDVNSLQELFNNSITNLIPNILNIIVVAIFMLIINYKLALASFILLPFIAISIFAIENFSRVRWQVYRQKRSTLNGYIHESFAGNKIVQSFAAETPKREMFSELTENMMNSFISAVSLNDLFWPIVELSWGIGTLLVYWYSSKLFMQHDPISIGTILAFSWYTSMFWRPIIDITQFYNTLITNFAAAERIFEILDIEPDIHDSNSFKQIPHIRGDVEFKNVTFGYEEHLPVLDNVSFKVFAGEKIALVGPTGAGKTTIVNLLSRFYDTDAGEVKIDGFNIKDYELESIRSQMGVMLQDTFLFSTSIMENIRYGKLDATDDEVVASAKAVHAHEFIMSLELGYATEVNERGSRLSIGQRQLISFARALLADPKILILDEATSNIDTFTEMLVQTGIEKLLDRRTSFVIAHRLSTIRDCDKIFVIDNGKIIQQGTHDELVSKNGMYQELYKSQYKFLTEGA